MTTSQNINKPIPGEGQLINLSVGQQATVKNLTITLVAVVNDSRCPEGAKCFWAGETIVEIKLSTPDNQEITTYLGTAGAPIMNPEKYVVNKENYRAQAYLFNRYAIIIEKVFPEKTTQEIVASAYKITFSVLSLGM